MNTGFAAFKLFALDSDKTIESISKVLDSINETINNMVNLLSQDPSTMSELWNIVESAVNISKTIALVLVVLYWLTHFIFAITEMDWRNISIWWYFREIVKLILAKALIDIAPDLCLSIFQFGAWAMQKYMFVGNISGDIFTSMNYDVLKASLEEMGFMEHLFFRIDLLVPKFIMWICNIAIQVVAYCRILQVCLMSIISSIPMATVASSSRHGAAIYFIKEYVGVVGQAVIIILAMLLYKGIVNSIIACDIGSFEGLMKICMSTVVLAITIFSAQKLAKMFVGH